MNNTETERVAIYFAEWLISHIEEPLPPDQWKYKGEIYSTEQMFRIYQKERIKKALKIK